MPHRTTARLARRNPAAALLAGLAAASALTAYRRRRATFPLDGAVVLVTGSSRGLGLALSREFARRGARLVLCARNAAELESARRELEAMGAQVLALPCDVGDREQVHAMIAEATRRFGEIDVLVNNAGIIVVGPVGTQTPEDFADAMNVMYWGVVHPTMIALPQMLARGEGRIVNVTSIGGRLSPPHLLPYNSAKYAAVGFSEGLRAELSGTNVRVTTVVPGFMRTGSQVNAYFKGRNRAEYAWFAVFGTLPLVSMSAERAARRIVEAARRGEAEIILTPLAQVAVRFAGMFPGTTVRLMELMNRALPGPGRRPSGRRKGRESESIVTRSPLTALGRKAALEYHQYVRPDGHTTEASGRSS